LRRGRIAASAFDAAGVPLEDEEAAKQWACRAEATRKQLVAHGMEDCWEDEFKLIEMLSRYAELKKAFEKNGFSELFEDPYSCAHFLKQMRGIKDLLEKAGLGYLLDSPVAFQKFLEEVEALRKAAAELEKVKAQLADVQWRWEKAVKDLQSIGGDAEEMRRKLAAYEALGSIEDLQAALRDAAALKKCKSDLRKLQEELADAKAKADEQARLAAEAAERERIMALKYGQLDVFKLDVIARELKILDDELGVVGKEAKSMHQDVGKIKAYEDQQVVTNHTNKMIDQCTHLRGHIRDVIHKCLSETQRLHIGAAVDDKTRAGVLADGGKVEGYFAVIADKDDFKDPLAGGPDANSKAHRQYHNDYMKGEKSSGSK